MKLLDLDKEQDIFLLFKEFTKSVSKFLPLKDEKFFTRSQ